jgi:dihydrofolate synthase / folylpolyglutamate synthase
VTFDEAFAWLYGTQGRGIQPGLEVARRLVRELGTPLESLRYLHVAGTNGKGSVCAMLDAVLREAGVRTGLFTSPHLVTFRERIRVNGEMIPAEDAARGLSRIRALTEGWEEPPTFFEITTALALEHFAKAGVDVAILETGLGGRLDATNIVTPLACGITPVGLDHQAFLGGTLAEIAREKAGIIKPGVPCVSAPQAAEAAEALRETAARVGAPLRFVDQPETDFATSLRGAHQGWNAALAVALLDAAGLRPADAVLRRGMAGVWWPGRFQVFDDGTVLDGAHNGQAARCLVATWREVFGDERPVVVFAALADKNVADVAAALCGLTDCFVVTRVGNPRSATGEAAADILQKAGAPDVGVARDVAEALAAARRTGRRVLVTGSLFLVGEALAVMEGAPGGLEVSRQ